MNDTDHTPSDASRRLEMVLMGTGTSVGVPVVGCDCDVCKSTDPRNQRMRTSVLVRASEGDFVIDTSPELRLQLVREHVRMIHAAVFTHAHADHLMGLDDLRIFGFRKDAPIALYCEENVETAIRGTFPYAFANPAAQAHPFSTPRLKFERISQEPFELLGLTIIPLRLHHGPLPILGFRIGNVAFCTDVSTIPAATRDQLQGLDVLVLDALRRKPHPTHMSLDQSIRMVNKLQPKHAYLTHLSHEFEHQALCRELPDHIDAAHDGLTIPLTGLPPHSSL